MLEVRIRDTAHIVERLSAGIAAVGALVAVGLAVHALPIVRAEFGRLAVSDLELAVSRQEELPLDRLATLSDVLRDSYVHRGDPALLQDLAFVQVLLRKRRGGQEIELNAIAERIQAGLAARPADPYGWARLARLRHQQKSNWRTVRDALVLAITTGSTVRRLCVARLRLGLSLWDRLGAYERGLVRRQARLAFRHDPEATVRVAVATGQASVVRAELDTVGAQARFDVLAADARR
jgi:hypothetical protein